MPKRLLITFESPITYVAKQGSSVSPDNNLISLSHIPLSPNLVPITQHLSPCVARNLGPTSKNFNFSWDITIGQFLKKNPQLITGIQCMMTNREIPQKTLVDMYQPEPGMNQKQKLTFFEAVQALFNQAQKTPSSTALVCYAVDLRTPLHKDYAAYQNFIKFHQQKQGIFRTFNYAPVDYMFSVYQSQFIANFQEFRTQFLLTQIHEGILDETIARFYSLKELSSSNISIDDLVDTQNLSALQKLLGKDKMQTSVRIQTNNQQKFQISQQQIRPELKGAPIVVFAVVSADNDQETMLQEPCDPREFQDYGFDEKDDCQYTVHMVFTLERVKNILEEKRQDQAVVKRQKPKGQQNQQDLTQIYELAPRIFLGFEPYQNYSKRPSQYSDCGLAWPGAVQQFTIADEIPYKPESVKYSAVLQRLCLQFSKKLDKFQVADVRMPAIFKKIFEMLFNVQAEGKPYLESLQQDSDNFGNSDSLKELNNNADCFGVLQGFLATATGYNSIFRYLVEMVVYGRFDIAQYFESLILLTRGLNHLLYYRIAIKQQVPYLEMDYLQPVLYQAWGCTQLYGLGCMQQAQLIQIDNCFEVPKDVVKKVEKEEEVPQEINSFLKFMLRFSIDPIGAKVLDKDQICYKVENNLELAETGQLPPKIHTLESTEQITSHLVGTYVYPKVSPKLERSPLGGADYDNFAKSELEIVTVKCNINNQNQRLTSELTKQFNDSKPLSATSIEQLIQLSKQPMIQPLRLVQNGDYPAPHSGSDMIMVSTFDEMVQKMKQSGYDVEGLILPEVTEPVSDFIDVTQYYHQSMLEASNNELFKFINTNFEVMIPKDLTGGKKYKSFFDFVEQNQAMISQLAFEVDLVALLADLQKNYDNFMPGMVYNKKLQQYYYFPLQIDQSKASISKQLDVDFFNQARQMQKFLFQNFVDPVQTVQSSILTLLDTNLLGKKFATYLNDHAGTSFTCQQLIGYFGQHVLELHQFGQIVKNLLGVEDLPIQLNDVFVEVESSKKESSAEEFLLDLFSGDLEDFVIENRLQLEEIVQNASVSIDQTMFKYLDKPESVPMPINQFQQFVLTKEKSFEPNVQLIKQAYQLQNQNQQNLRLYFKQLQFATPFIINGFDFGCKQPAQPRNMVVLGRIRGLLIAKQLQMEKLSADAEISGCKKAHGFVSVELTERCFQLLLKIGQKPGRDCVQRFYADLEDQYCRVESAFQRQCVNVPIFFSQLGLANYQRMTKILAPLFKSYGKDQVSALKPLVDVFGRVLRTQSPYQVKLSNEVSNEPAPLEYEAPPQPAAAGEEASMQHLIDFWEQIKNKFFCIPDDRIRALQSPLYCLEEREIEFYNNSTPITCSEVAKQNESGQQQTSCQCSQFSAVMYPNPHPSLQLDSYQKGIYYMSPYYTPVEPEFELCRLSIFQDLVKQGCIQISCLMRQKLNQIFGLENSDQDKNQMFVQTVQRFFIRRWPAEQKAEHFRLESEKVYADVAEKRCPHNNFHEDPARLEFVKKIRDQMKEKSIDGLTRLIEANLNVPDVDQLVYRVLEEHPLLDLFQYGDPEQYDNNAPVEVVEYLHGPYQQQAAAEVHRHFMQGQKSVQNEVLAELSRKQMQLRVLEKENLERNIQAAHRLQMCKYQDIHNETVELYVTYLNAHWGKICQQSRLNPSQKIGYDQLCLGGFETGPLTVGPELLDELNDLEAQNGISWPKWDNDEFNIEDIVEFK